MTEPFLSGMIDDPERDRILAERSEAYYEQWLRGKAIREEQQKANRERALREEAEEFARKKPLHLAALTAAEDWDDFDAALEKIASDRGYYLE